MENTKAKNVLIIILIILVIGIIAYTIWMNYENKKQVDSLKEQIEKNNTVINENKEETKTSENDIYAKYESLNIKWAGTSDGKYDDIKIQDGKVYIQGNILVTGYEGTPKKVLKYVIGGLPQYLLLTQQGDVYGTDNELLGDVGKNVNVTKKESDILDIASNQIEKPIGSSNILVYYLTNKGELITGIGGRIIYDISKAQVTGVSNKWYTGSAIKQSLTVTFEGKKLVEKTDYTVAYKNNVKVGTAVITIKGIGEYTGTKEVTFKVLDQYANYKGIKWSGTSAGDKEYTYVYIKNGKAYIDQYDDINNKYEIKNMLITGYKDTVKKVDMYEKGGGGMIVLLTNSGDVYEVDYSSDVGFSKSSIKSQKIMSGVIDMALGSYHQYSRKMGMYYLKTNGKLVDEYGSVVNSIEQ